MKNLIVGKTSQLTNYLLDIDNNIELKDSRDFDVSTLLENKYDKIFILFAEQRTFLNENLSFYKNINVDYTFDILNKLSKKCNRIVVFGSSELWNQYSGPINIKLPFNYHNSGYIESKELFINKLKNTSFDCEIKVIHPFNYNSPLRKKGFLFQKFMDVILYKKHIDIGNVNIQRDIVHPKLIAQECFKDSNEDVIVGSGKLINVKSFYINLLSHFKINYNDYVTENFQTIDSSRKNSYFLDTNNIYQTLLEDTIKDVERFKNKISTGHN
jgi:nucleoside-diphosphate-sugar epimerase